MSVKQAIPIFPLHLFLLPGETRELYIFEERYKQLIEDVLAGNKLFGIAFSDKRNINNLGSLVTISEVLHRYPGGEMDIRVQATGIFQLESFYLQQQGKLYPGGHIIEKTDVQNHPASALLLKSFELQSNALMKDTIIASPSPGIFDIARALQLSDEEKIELITSTDDLQMNNYLLKYLQYLSFMYEQENAVFHSIYLN